MDKELMNKNNEGLKKIVRRGLSMDELDQVSGGGAPYGGIICNRCGGIKDNPNIGDEEKCHCDEGPF